MAAGRNPKERKGRSDLYFSKSELVAKDSDDRGREKPDLKEIQEKGKTLTKDR